MLGLLSPSALSSAPTLALPNQYNPANKTLEHSGSAPFSLEKAKVDDEEFQVLELPSISTYRMSLLLVRVSL